MSCESISQDWCLAIYHDYSKDMKFDENIKIILSWWVIMQFNHSITQHSERSSIWNHVKFKYLSIYISIWWWWFDWWISMNYFNYSSLLWSETLRVIILWDHIGCCLLLQGVTDFLLTTYNSMHTSPYPEYRTYISKWCARE